MHYSRCLIHSLLLILTSAAGVFAQQPQQTQRKVENPIGVAEEEKKALRKLPSSITITVQTQPGQADEVTFLSERQEIQGDTTILSGNVEVSGLGMLLKADRLMHNRITEDVLAEGNVYFEQEGQKLTGERMEFNLRTRRGSIYTARGLTNRTPDGTTLIIKAGRVDKTGLDTYLLDRALLTACEEPNPKWSFTASRARIRLDDRAALYNPVFRIKGFPILYLPYISLSTSKKDRSSGFLLPSSGSSNIKGRTVHLAYYQTLGRSADILVRTDVFTKRGLGFGFDFRAKPDENSRIAIGSFIVLDRLFGEKGPDQGGSSFYADAVQYFKNGFVAVADVNITSSFAFRQVFAENVLQAVSPEERSLFYLNRNWKAYSLNLSLNEQSTFIAQKDVALFDSEDRVTGRGDVDNVIKLRQFPGFNLSKRSSEISERIPIYFSFEASLEGVRRSESRGDQSRLRAPSIVQRLDFAPRLTLPLRSFAGGFTLTPSIGLRSTFYSDSLSTSFDAAGNLIRRTFTGDNLFRNYAELELDFRPPALARIFRHRDGTPWFKHVIEPYITYRRIAGIAEYERTPLIDEHDAVASTSEIEYGLDNRFFVRRPVGPDGQTKQAYEILSLSLAQKHFFDPTFGGALRDCGTNGLTGCQRQQFFPLNTLSGFAFGGIQRNLSPINLRARVRPTQVTFADVRLDFDTRYSSLRNLVVSGGYSKGLLSLSHSWYFTRLIAVDQFRLEDKQRFDPSTYPGNQLDISTFLGNPSKGPYGGFTVAYDFRDKDIKGIARDQRLIYLTSTAGWAWDCCSFQIQNINFKAGLRNENRILFAFTLKGIGTFGTENIGQRRRRFGF
jgi:LPS-assembly protein